MASCKLDLEHPKFRIDVNVADLQAGLTELRDLVAKDYKLSGWVSHPMPKFPQYQNRIWKWDFRPQGERSSTRKGWRLYAYVPDPKAQEPILAIAFLCYDKSDTPKGDHVKYLAGLLRKFLAEVIRVEDEDERFKRQTDSDGTIISLCLKCWVTAAMSTEIADIETAEDTHECPP